MKTTRRDVVAGGGVASLLSAAGASLTGAAALAQTVVENDVAVSASDVTASASDTVARVPVVLSRPADRTMVIDYMTQNGSGGAYGAREGAPGAARSHYLIAQGQIVFQPGEQRTFVEVKLLRPLARGQSILLRLSDYFGYPQHKYLNRIAQITADNGGAPRAAPAMDRVALPPRPRGGSLVFQDDLLDPAFANDSGARGDGKPCWQSRPSHGRTQDGNKELGYYADPALHREAKVWGVGADGRRFIQAEYLKNGIADGRGGQLTMAWRKDADAPYLYSAAMVTSRRLFNRITLDNYVEFEVKLANVVGSWPALWLLPSNGSWPPEIDLLEAFIKNAAYPADAVTSSLHWGDRKSHRTYGTTFPLGRVAPHADIFARYNRFGCYLGERRIVFYFNDQPYCAIPNQVGPGPWYMLLNVAVGGFAGKALDPAQFPARMSIAGVKVWRH